jgi:hypothetical protein
VIGSEKIRREKVGSDKSYYRNSREQMHLAMAKLWQPVMLHLKGPFTLAIFAAIYSAIFFF